MSDLSSGQLEGVLAVVTGQEMETPGEVLYVTRREQPSLFATLLSAWERDGRELGPALTHELGQQRERMAFYRDLQGRLAERWDNPVSLKGLEVADRYPAPLLRYMNDLDYWVGEEERLWGIVAWLLEAGWSLHSATFFEVRGELQVLVSLRRLPDDPFALPYGVELGTVALMGDRAGVPARVDLPRPCAEPIAKNFTAMLMERFEQPFRARDLVDAAVLLGDAPRDALKGCALAVHELALWPEYAELVSLLAESPLDVPALPGDLPRLVRASRTRRAAAAAESLRRPVNAVLTRMQSRMMEGRWGALGRRAWGLVETRMDARTALRAGLLLFALPVEGDHHADRATLRERAGGLWADTPVGGFVLVHGEEVDESALAGTRATGALSDPDERATGAPGDLETGAAEGKEEEADR